MFSTSTICFLGFGLKDLHFNLILDLLNTINEGQSITHYAFLTSKSEFEIHSIEKKNGIRIIEYFPSNSSHPEVEEFVSLIGDLKRVPKENDTIKSEANLVSLIENKFQSFLGIYNFSIVFNKSKEQLSINYFSRARTEFEQQKEILSIFKLFNFKTNLVNEIKICCYIESEPNIEFVKFSPLILVCFGKFNNAKAFAESSMSDFDFWKTLLFNQPFSIGNIHFTDRAVNLPYLNF